MMTPVAQHSGNTPDFDTEITLTVISFGRVWSMWDAGH